MTPNYFRFPSDNEVIDILMGDSNSNVLPHGGIQYKLVFSFFFSFHFIYYNQHQRK